MTTSACSTTPHIVILDGPQRGHALPLPPGRTIVGRERDCQVQLGDPHVSRHHCVFLRDEYAVRLRDLGSRNGTFVNGLPCRGEQVLQYGDVISLGTSRLQFTSSARGVADETLSIQDQTVTGDPPRSGRSRILM